MTEKTCNLCIHFGACSKWTDFPKQCGVPVCASFSEQSEKYFIKENGDILPLTHQSEWISVTERLPKTYESVLVYMPGETPNPTVHEGFLNRFGRWYAGGFDRLPDEVVMWMYLPEPPKMKGGE